MYLEALPRVALILPLATGAALAIHILTDLSLPTGLCALGVLGSAGFAAYWAQLIPPARRALALRLRTALVVGLLATGFYDLTRLAIGAGLAFSINPFEAWPIFGQLLTGAARGSDLAAITGFLYHLVNGVGFGMAYSMAVRKPGPVSGIAWGLGLELIMALLYPSWLRIRALEEFLTLSVIGHVAYGLSLGLLSKRMLTGRWR